MAGVCLFIFRATTTMKFLMDIPETFVGNVSINLSGGNIL